jgi:hypothetical protein
MQHPKVKFPYGISNFEKLVEQDYVFVDKTSYIEMLEREESYSIFLRPRRMGKSLFVSILEYYYDILEKDKFEKIFSKFYIGQNPTAKASSYRVLKFDFSGIDTQTEADTFKFFLDIIKETLATFMGRYNLLHPHQQGHVLEGDSPGNVLRRFFESYKLWKEKTGDELPIYILIDEYDHFTNEILIRNLSEFKRSVSEDGYIRKFYEAIKIATQQGFVDRFFITGVSPITLDGLTSGFNIGKHLTGKKEFHDLMGFTELETLSLLNLVLKDKSKEVIILNDLKNWYNGYRFNIDVLHTVYNSDMVLYFLDNFKGEQLYPSQMLDPNIMPDYGKLMKLLKVADYRNNISVLKQVLEQGFIASELIYQFNFEKPFDKTAFINLLYYLGNLTQGSKDELTGFPKFVIPNYVIGQLFWQNYALILQEQANLEYNTDIIKDALVSAAGGEIGNFFELVQQILEGLSNRDYQRFDEKYIKTVIIAYLSHAPFYYIRTEREIGNDGYIDLEVLRHPDKNSNPLQYVMEIKYLKQSDSDKLHPTMQAAKNQLQSYLQKDAELKSQIKLKSIALVAVKDKLYWEEL